MSLGQQYTPPKNVLPIFNNFEFIISVDGRSTILANTITETNRAQEIQISLNNSYINNFTTSLSQTTSPLNQYVVNSNSTIQNR